MTIARSRWMCIKCHEKGHPGGTHPDGKAMIYGTCWQCACSGMLLECHEYDFRIRPEVSREMEGMSYYSTIDKLIQGSP